ncbi:VanW family protein [Desulfofundulus salinus]|uniref:Vanomycin resistance protein VanB n=1 Tax=Desulfofundulus salinus TaxID=2419843 RepID=A0A494WTI4_9FIRM|nr:VanW family protein [Desulfofundulus salinum]RKO66696.1 vanomycin resistance protein VanB [Desulfofundulus salinum]
MRRTYLVIVGFITGIFLAVGAVGATSVYGREQVVPGVRVAGIDLSGMDREACRRVLASLEEKLNTTPVVFHYRDRTWTFSPPEIGLRLDTQAILTGALQAGRDAQWWLQWYRQWKIKKEGYELPLMVVLSRQKFNQKLNALAGEIATPPRDAAFRVLPDDRIEIVPGHDGMKVDEERAYRDLLSALSAGKKPEIQLNMVHVKPQTTTEEVQAMGLKGLLSSYTTSFDASYTDRAYNIRVAAAALDGLLVPPGQEVSFNKVVGPRSSEAGYKNAKVIVNNQLVDGLGGGVCQVSSTLYNAVLLANLEVLERTNHSLPVPYVPVGRDATVVYGAIDFRFRNNTESYIYIRSAVNGGRLTFKIYGNTDYKVPVEIHTRITEVLEPKVVREPDPNLERGEQVVKQKGVRGYRVVTERVVRENGQLYTERLPGSFYKPVNQVVAIGTREPSTGPVVPPPSSGQKPPPDKKPPAAGDSPGKTPADEEDVKPREETPEPANGEDMAPPERQSPEGNGSVPEVVYPAGSP